MSYAEPDDTLEQGKTLENAEAMVALLSPAALAVVVRPVKEMPWILETQVLRIDA